MQRRFASRSCANPVPRIAVPGAGVLGAAPPANVDGDERANDGDERANDVHALGRVLADRVSGDLCDDL